MSAKRKPRKPTPGIRFKRRTLYLVVQEGGSSCEHYPSLYNRRADATRAARGHRRASYRSTEPIPVEASITPDGTALVGEQDLIDLVEAVRDAPYL